ncbi:MAG: protein kinase [Blastocatellia bacterium]|nr:protein kinase [Blastocatellia bacterium]
MISVFATVSARACLAALVLLAWCGVVWAQPQEARFTRFSIESGLSQSVINCILQDRDGYIWVGTEDGLNRFDGRGFTIFRHQVTNPNSLSNSFIWALCEDRKGDLWVGTDYGLNRFDRGTGQFIRYLNDPANPASLSANIIRYLYEDRQGQMWVGTSGGGLNRMDPATGRCTRYQHDPQNQHTLGANYVSVVYEDKAGAFWVGTPGFGGMSRLNPVSGYCQRFQHNPQDPTSLGDDWVRTMCEDHLGNFWVGTHNGGLNLMDRATGRFTRFLNDPNHPASLSHNDVQTLFEDRQGRLWVGTYNGGLDRLDRQTGGFTHFRHHPNHADTLSNNSIRAIYEDQGGILWIGTASGLNQLDPTPQKFTSYQHDPGDPNSLSHDAVRALYGDREGKVWIGTVDGGLNRLDPQTGDFIRYHHDPKDPASLSADWVSAICETKDGALWVGTRSGGLNRLDRRTGRFTCYQRDPEKPNSLSWNNICALYEDRTGSLWIGTVSGELNRFDPQTGLFSKYISTPKNPVTISSSTTWTILEDRAGNLWLGTYDGLNRLDPQTGRCFRYLHDPQDPASLSHNNVSFLHEDRTGVLWIGTYGGGLNRMDPVTGKFAAYTTKNGLPNDAIHGILEDQAGHLWLSTNYGICRFNPQTGTCQNFDVSDGLQSNEFDVGSCFQTAQGEMYFGGTGGFTRFHPSAIKGSNTFVPPVVISAFYKFDKKVESFNGKKLDPLPYSDNFVTFEFAALNYIHPEKNTYAYRLVGVDRDWIYCGTRRAASYTDLAPGTYLFQVKGSNNDGVWNETGAAVRLVITPPPWRTWWAYLLYSLTGISLLAGAFYFQAQQVRAQTQLQLAQTRALAAEAERRAIEAKAEAALSEKEAAQARAELAEIGAQVAGELAHKNLELEDKNFALECKNQELQEAQQQADRIFSALAEALPGTILDGKYRLDEKLGAGGFGVVFRATHLGLDRPIAVKVFRPKAGNDSAEAVERFKREGISASRLRHPNIIQIFDSGISAEGIAYLVMELLEGHSLADEMRQRHCSVLRCRQVIVPVCEALAEAHRQNIIHRDIKPENIFLHQSDEGEVVKVVDFGIAKMLGDDEADIPTKITVTGLIIGTPLYMAPERLQGDAYDERSDVYSVGVVVYQMLSGYTPHHTTGRKMWDLVRKILQEPPVPLRDHNPAIPPDIEAVVMKSLIKDPKARLPITEWLTEWVAVADRHISRVKETPTARLQEPGPEETVAFRQPDPNQSTLTADMTGIYRDKPVARSREKAVTLVQQKESVQTLRASESDEADPIPTTRIESDAGWSGFETNSTGEGVKDPAV